VCRQFSRFVIRPQWDLRDSGPVHLSVSPPCASPVLPFRHPASTGSSRFWPCPLSSAVLHSTLQQLLQTAYWSVSNEPTFFPLPIPQTRILLCAVC
jgi:hypothetical protein